MKRQTKSPLTDVPLRYPGQSLDEELERLWDDKGINYSLTLIFPVMLAAYEWFRWYFNVQPHPIMASIVAIPFVVYAIYQLIKLKNQIKKLKLGRDGERAVGQFLEGLRAQGHRVFHDIVGEGFNLDHVVIGENGVFVIETKTYSKPVKGKALIKFNGSQITIDGYNSDDKILTQARAQASWLTKVIKDSTGKDISVKPVIVFPGWFIESSQKALSSNVWVLNPKGLPTFINNNPKQLITEDVMLLSYHLSRYIRTKTMA